MYTKEELESCIKDLKVAEKRLDQECYHKMQHSNPYTREITRLETMIEFIDLGVEFEEYSFAYIKIIRKWPQRNIIYALRTRNWRAEGKSKWYRSGDVKKFVQRFVVDESQKSSYKEDTTKENTDD